MYQVKYKSYELPAKDVRINQTILLIWVFAMFSFMFGLFLGKGNFAMICMLLLFASMLLGIPIVMIIKSRQKRLQVEIIKELSLTCHDQKLYHDNTQLYVHYDRDSEKVHLYSTSTTTKGLPVKILDIVILEEENSDFLHFCEENHIPTMHSRNYII